MSLETDVRTAVQDIKDGRDQITADAATLHAIAHGPASGAASLVATEGGDVKTAARAIAEFGSGAAYATKDLANVTGILSEEHGGSGTTSFASAVADAMASSFPALAHSDRLANDRQAREDLGIDVVVRSATQAGPPSGPASGDAYLVPAGASGAWASHVGKVAIWATPTAGVWNYRTPTLGWSVWATDTNTLWEYDFEGWTAALAGSGSGAVYAALDGRIVKVAKTHRGSGCKLLPVVTADGRLMLFGDNSVLPFNPVGIRGSAYELPLPWDASAVTIEEVYLGSNYLLVQTSESSGNLYALGANAHGQCADGTTTNVLGLKRIQKFVDDAVKITRVFTEAVHGGNGQPFWFALTSGGNVYACGSSANYTTGYNSLTNLTTPRKMTLSGGAALADVAEIACDTIYGPVFARTNANTAYVWGAGTDGAHGLNTTSAASWPAAVETSTGSGIARTDIAQIVTTSSAEATTRAVTWLRTTAGAVQVSGSRYYGNGDGAALLAASVNTFQPITGALAALTVAALYAGGGEYYNCVAITSTGQGYVCGYMAGYALRGDGATTNLATFAAFVSLPSGFAGALTGCLIAGGNTTTTVYLEATIAGRKQVASIGYDGSYQTAKGTTGVAAAAQTWGLVKGARGTLTAWGAFGTQQVVTLWQLNTDNELRTAGGNDQGQAGVSPGQTTALDVLQPVRTGLPRLLKGPTPHGDASWSGTTTYAVNDLVPHEGSVWRCRVPASLNVSPPSLPTTLNSDWQCWSQKGDTGAGTAATVSVGTTTVVTPAAGPSVTNAGSSSDADLRFSLPRARNISIGTVTTGAPGSSASVTPTTDGNGDILLAIAIPRGDTGADSTVPGAAGAGYGGTATDTLTLGSGTKTANIGIGYAYTSGMRVRLASAGGFMEGNVASYTGGALTISVASASDVSGTGTYSAWTAGVAGLPGAGGGTPGGSSGSVQVNSGGSLAGAPKLGYDTATDTTQFRVDAGTLFERPASSSLNSVNYRFIVSQNPFTDGSGVGGENYANEVVGFGWNMAGIGVPADPSKAMVWDGWEYKYNIAGKYHHERHMEMVYPGAGDVSTRRLRFFSFAVPHDGGSGSSHGIWIDTILWATLAGATKVQWNMSSNNAYFGSTATGYQLVFQKNNVAPLQQRNAGDTAYVALPYINSSDKLVCTGQTLFNAGGTVATGSAAFTFDCTQATLSASSFCFSAAIPALTNKDFGAYSFQGSTNYNLYARLHNVHASGRAQQIVQCGASGRASYKASDGTTDWVWGINSSDNYFLGSDEFGSDNILTADKTNRNVSFVKPPKLPSYTVATLPSASTYGAGSQAYASNGRKSGEGAGSGTGVPVWSNGTNWLTYYDNSIVAA